MGVRGKLKSRVEKHSDLQRRLGRKQALQKTKAGSRHDDFWRKKIRAAIRSQRNQLNTNFCPQQVNDIVFNRKIFFFQVFS